MKLHEALARVVRAQGVDTIFGVLGDGNLFFADSFVRAQAGRYCPAAHEAGATQMAVGYASRSGRVGVATTTHGPGLTNAFSSIVTGVRSRVPLVLIVGDTPETARYSPQNIDQREVIKATGAIPVEARVADQAVHDLVRAFDKARRDMLPVVFSVPSDLMWADVAEFEPPSPSPRQAVTCLPPPAVLEDVAAILSSAKRPIVVAGRGVPAADRGSVRALADRIGAPLGTTLLGKGTFSAAEGCFGIFGTLSTPAALDVISASDCVIFFGASLNYLTTDRGRLLTGKRVIRVDINPDPETAPFVTSPVNVTGDAGSVARALLALLDEAEIPPTTFRDSPVVAQSLKSGGHHGDSRARSDEYIDIDIAMRALNDALPARRTLVTDGGRFMRSALRIIDVPSPEAYVFATSFHCVGMGMPAAIGACLATDDPVLLVTGDGGFMMGGVAELHAAVREGLDLVVAICNDGGYGAEYAQLRNRGMDPAISLIPWPDFAEVSAAIGCASMTVRTRKDLTQACDMITQRDRPVVLDLRLDPEFVPM